MLTIPKFDISQIDEENRHYFESFKIFEKKSTDFDETSDEKHFLDRCQDIINDAGCVPGALSSQNKQMLPSDFEDTLDEDELSSLVSPEKKVRAKEIGHQDTQMVLGELFNTSKNWYDLSGKIEDFEEYDHIKERWNKRKDFAHYSSEGLYTLGLRVVPLLEPYLTLLKKEIETFKPRLSKDEQKALQKYLTRFERFLNKLTYGIGEAMAERLRVAHAHRDLYFDDVVMDTVSELKTIGALDESVQIKDATRGLSPELFLAFHDYLVTHEKGKAFSDLKNELPWLKKSVGDELLSVTLSPRERKHAMKAGDTKRLRFNTFVFVPAELRPHLTDTPFKLLQQILSGGFDVLSYLKQDEVRYQILKRKAFADKTLNLHDLGEALHDADALAKEVEEILTRLNLCQAQKPKGLFKFLQFGRAERLKAVEHLWQSNLTDIAQQAIEAIETLLKKWEAVIKQGDPLRLTKDESALVEKLTGLLENLEARQALEPVASTALEALKKRKLTVDNYCEDYQEQLDALTEGLVKGNGYFKGLKKYVDLLKKTPKQRRWLQFQPKLVTAARGYLTPYRDLLIQLADSNTALNEEDTANLRRCICWMDRFGDKSFIPSMQKNLKDLMDSYLSALHQFCTVPELCLKTAEWFEQVACILRDQSKSLGFNDWAEAVEHLRQLREAVLDGSQSAHTELELAVADCQAQRVREHTLDTLVQLREDYSETLWERISSTFRYRTETCNNRMQQLLQQAHELQLPSISALGDEGLLTSSDETLLGLHKSSGQPLKWLETLYQLQCVNLDTTNLSEDELNTLSDEWHHGHEQAERRQAPSIFERISKGLGFQYSEANPTRETNRHSHNNETVQIVTLKN